MELLVWNAGNAFLPLTLLDGTPFKDFVVPGLLLAVVVGGTSMVNALATARRYEWRIDATLLAGGALSAWTACEVALLQAFSWLQVLYGGLGLGLLGIGIARGQSLRQRWIVRVTLAESFGYMAPTLAGVMSVNSSPEHRPLAWAIVMAGCFEGLCLGYGQARALPWQVSKWRYALLTSIAAGGVWAAVFALMSCFATGEAMSAVQWLAVAIGGGLSLSAIGGAQWLLLRRLLAGAGTWVFWTALAWAVALPLSFLPAPLVDESTPLLTHVVIWGFGGVVMAYVMAWFTWYGVKALQRANPNPTLRARN